MEKRSPNANHHISLLFLSIQNTYTIRKSITTKALLATSTLSTDLDSNQTVRLAITASSIVKDMIFPHFWALLLYETSLNLWENGWSSILIHLFIHDPDHIVHKIG